MHREAIADLKMARELSGESPAMTMQLGYAYAMARRRDEARQMLNVLTRLARKTYVPALQSGAIHTGLRDQEQALRWLRRAYQQRCDTWCICAQGAGRRCPAFRPAFRRPGSASRRTCRCAHLTARGPGGCESQSAVRFRELTSVPERAATSSCRPSPWIFAPDILC
jgi:hypothetical protein